jgi:hypothetical protein
MIPRNRRPGSAGWLGAVALAAGVGAFAAIGLAAPGEAVSGGPAGAETDVDTERRDFDAYRENVEPIFVRPRGYPQGEPTAACVMCHVWQTSLRFALEDMTEIGGSWSWTDEQSMRNYEVVTQLVNASDPASSKLLLKPLSTDAGGEGHTGGNYWNSTDDPEYQAILEWIELLPATDFTPPPEPTLDFEFYRACVQEVVMGNPRPGQLPCAACHSGGTIGFAPRPANGTSWSDAEARRGFDVISRLVLPGNPEESRWLLKPLHPDGGGSYTHNGVRRWQTRDDPEWQMLAAWVRGERSGSSCSM